MHWLYDGYMHVLGDEGDAHSDMDFESQLKLDMDIGRFAGLSDHIYTGVQFYFWNNKYGVESVDERVVAPLLQARFSF